MATRMVSTTVSFPTKKLFLQNENLDNFRSRLLKNYILHIFKIWYRFLFMFYVYPFG